MDKPGHLWYIRYPLTDGSGDLVVATTRPETMMGDTGVAVNPEDERFKDLVGKTCILPIMNREIPIVADDYVELGFGTGAVKMTPAHDPNDFEVGLRHNLEVIRCIGDDGKINENGGPYNGMDRYECRRQIVKDLEEQGYLVKTEPYSHNVGTCLPLPQRRGAPDLRPVVREDGAPGERGPACGPGGRGEVRPGAVLQDLYQLDGERPRLVQSPGSCGGDTRSPPGTATTAATSTSPGRIRQSVKSAAAPI